MQVGNLENGRSSYHGRSMLTTLVFIHPLVPPPSILSYVPSTTRVDAVDSFLRERDKVCRDLWDHLLQARDPMKAAVDRRRRDVNFAIGD